MIVLDTDVLILDLRFPRDARFANNRRFLEYAKNRLPLAMTCHGLLEVIGKLSFSVQQADILKLTNQLPHQYGFQVVPHPTLLSDYAACSVGDVLAAIGERMALGDAVNAVQIVKFMPTANCLLTWNAKHYQGKLAIPVLTPDEWWQQNQPAS